MDTVIIIFKAMDMRIQFDMTLNAFFRLEKQATKIARLQVKKVDELLAKAEGE